MVCDIWGTEIKIRIVFILMILSLLSGCTTTAKKYTITEDGVEKQVLELKGIGKAKFEDKSSIEGEPIIKFPDLPPIKYEN